MVAKLQYNPSTGKIHFTAATGKVQVVVGVVPHDCAGCANPPDEIDVTISGVTALCCTTSFDDTFSNKVNDAFLAEVNQTHRIPILTSSTDRCVWFNTETVYTGLACDLDSTVRLESFGPDTPAPGCGGAVAFSQGYETISYTYNVLSDGSALFRISSNICGSSRRVNQIWDSTTVGGNDDCIPTDVFTETLGCPASTAVNARNILTGGTISIVGV